MRTRHLEEKRVPEIVLTETPDGPTGERLLRYCLDRGVSCFTVTASLSGSPEDLRRAEDDLFKRLAPFTMGNRTLEQTTVYAGSDCLQSVKCWRFDDESKKVIFDLTTGLLVMAGVNVPEDWTFYRDDKLFLGVVSHEEHVFLRLDEDDLNEFELLGIAFGQ